jgi:sarcosine oxidase subunit beta
MTLSADVVIVGAGIVGASVAYHLARRGVTNVTVVEKEPTEVTGSTARSAAGVRHQFSSPTNVQLSLYSIERLKHFHEEVGGHSDLRQVGYLFLVNSAHDWQIYQQNVAMQRSLGARVELLSPAEVQRFVPGTVTDDLLGATFGPDDGYCDPHGIAIGYLRAAQALGVRLLRNAGVEAIELSGGRISGVRTAAGAIACETVINCAGAWSGQVAALAGLEVPIRPYRRCVYVTTPFDGIPNPMPLTIDVGSGFYMRHEGRSLLLGRSNTAEPSSTRLTVDWDWLDQVLDAGLARFPLLENAGLAEQQCWAGLYEITPDGNPILGRDPLLPGFLHAGGFSGHGVMHAPATGLLLAEELIDGRARTIDLDPLRITRFAAGAAAGEYNVV